MVLGPDFSKILTAAKGGAEWAWADLYRDLAGAVRGYFRARGALDAEDLASETFLQVARDIQSFDGDEDGFRSWVFVIAHRRLIDSWRAAGSRPRSTAIEEPLRDIQGGDVEEEALDRIAKGHYGKCLHCSQEISPKRLEVLPFARLCVPCQEKIESKNR